MSGSASRRKERRVVTAYGAMVGLMNSLSQLGGFAGSVLYGYIVAHTHSYNAAFYPMAALLFVGALIWTQVDSTQDVGLMV